MTSEEIKELQAQLNHWKLAAEQEAKFADEYKKQVEELKESLCYAIQNYETIVEISSGYMRVVEGESMRIARERAK